MKEIRAQEITRVVAEICQQANYELGDDVLTALEEAQQKEKSKLARYALEKIIQNAALAKQKGLPLCQDCGTAVIFLEIGQDVHITRGDINKAIVEGVYQGYRKGYLRKSMVNNPLSTRMNTGDNTPPVVNIRIVPGNRLKIAVMPKGGGTENASRLAMLKPGVGNKGVVDVVVKTIDEVGANPCPPLIIGLGIGGTAEKAMLLAKEALLRKLGEFNPDPEVARLEKDILDRVNDLGIGALGLGGSITALAVHAEVFPAHIASLPVAINLQCHSARHREVIL
ncbi:MAG: fumarate hydratase [Dehalococcoidia bacterium]|nr:MAG: fumarate hydratase [Dehalococcoidia bacterium]